VVQQLQRRQRPASFALGITGAVSKLSTHDYVGALLAAAAGFLGVKQKEKVETGA
jgi:hypothetical protein